MLVKKDPLFVVSDKIKGTWLMPLGIAVTMLSLWYAFEFGGGFYGILFGPIISGMGYFPINQKEI